MRALPVQRREGQLDPRRDVAIRSIVRVRHPDIVVAVGQGDLAHPGINGADLVTVAAFGRTGHVGNDTTRPRAGPLRPPGLDQRPDQREVVDAVGRADAELATEPG